MEPYSTELVTLLDAISGISWLSYLRVCPVLVICCSGNIFVISAFCAAIE